MSKGVILSDSEILCEAKSSVEDIYNCYLNSKFSSIKHSSYFQVYAGLLGKFRGEKITFIEIGVLNGGSLFMWRSYFGDQARIIGIDLNPAAKKWETYGFEIYIGNQANPLFWEQLFSTVGNVDIILDDGGHTNEQQIVTVEKCIPHINDGGLLIVEDVHTSYFKEFGNPSRYSFVNYAKRLIDSINSRFPSVLASKNELRKLVYSITFFESVVCFAIDRTKCFISSPTSNGGVSSDIEDFRHHESGERFIFYVKGYLDRNFKYLRRFNFLNLPARYAYGILLRSAGTIRSRKLRKYFS